MTLARKICSDCRRTMQLAVWPWSGRAFVTSHGLCRRCLHRLRPQERVA